MDRVSYRAECLPIKRLTTQLTIQSSLHWILWTKQNGGDRRPVSMFIWPPILPEGVYIVVTTRPDKDIPLQVVSKRDLDIEPDLAGNLLDIRAFLENYANRSEMQVRINDWKIDTTTFEPNCCTTVRETSCTCATSYQDWGRKIRSQQRG